MIGREANLNPGRDAADCAREGRCTVVPQASKQMVLSTLNDECSRRNHDFETARRRLFHLERLDGAGRRMRSDDCNG